MGVFNESHVRVGTPAVVFVGSVKIEITDGGVVNKFHIHAIGNPFVADMVGPEFVYVLAGGAYGFKAVAAFDQVRVHIVNREVAVDVVPRTFVTAHGDGCSAEIGATAHAHETLVRLGGNPVAPRLQIVRFLHDFESGFTEARAAIFLEGDAVELVRLACHAVRLATSRAAPSTPLLVRLGHRIAHLPKVVSAFGHENRDRIVALQVLADACGIACNDDFACVATCCGYAKAFGLHIEREKEHCCWVGFIACPNPFRLCVCGEIFERTATRELVVCVRKRCGASPLREVAALVFPGVVADNGL